MEVRNENIELDNWLDDDIWRSAISEYEKTLVDVLIEQTPLNTHRSLTTLLKHLSLKEEELSQAQVNLPALQKLINQHPIGKAWSFFLSLNFLKLALTVPCLSTRDVKSPLTVDNLPFQIDERDNKDEHLAVMKKETVSPSLPDMHRSVKSGCRPLLLTSALVFESQVALRKASAIKSFHETVQLLIDGTWGLFASSLIVNAIVNLILFPVAYAQENKAIYLVSLPLIIWDYLRNAKPNPVVYLSLLIIPLGLGLINALISAYRVPLQDQDHGTQIQTLLQHLKNYDDPGYWRDLVGWFTKTLPDAFPVVGLCALVFQVRIQRALERITFALIWDGRLSLQARTTLFDGCRRFSRDSRHLTRLQANCCCSSKD